MKKLVFYFVLFFVLGTPVLPTHGQGTDLSNLSQMLKTERPGYYEPIRNFAIKKWEDDHRMVLFEINKQVKDLIFLIKEVDPDNLAQMEIFNKSYHKWRKEPFTKETDPYTIEVDWSMVRFEFDTQLKAYKQY